MKSYYIYLIRNGLTEESLEGKYIGHTDVELSEEGEKQILQMKKELIYPEVDALFTSPLKRCKKTAELIYPHIKAIEINDLIEYNFGEYEGLSADDLKENKLFARWLAGEKGVEPPFGESSEDFAKRICECFKKIAEGLMKTGTTRAAVVTHGGVITSLLSAYGLPEAPMHEWMMPCGCGYEIRLTPFLWSSGEKFEVVSEIPYEQSEDEEEEDYFFS